MTEPADSPEVREYPVGDPDAVRPVVYGGAGEQFRWGLKSVNHKTIGAATESYGNRDDCIENCLTVTQRSAYVLKPGVHPDAIPDSFTAITSATEFIARPVR